MTYQEQIQAAKDRRRRFDQAAAKFEQGKKAALDDASYRALWEEFTERMGHGPPGHRIPRFSEIKDLVCQSRRVSLSDIDSSRRFNSIGQVRHIVFYLGRRLTKLSLVQMGEYMGGKDHTSVMYGIQKVTERVARDPEFRREIAALEQQLVRHHG